MNLDSENHFYAGLEVSRYNSAPDNAESKKPVSECGGWAECACVNRQTSAGSFFRRQRVGATGQPELVPGPTPTPAFIHSTFLGMAHTLAALVPLNSSITQYPPSLKTGGIITEQVKVFQTFWFLLARTWPGPDIYQTHDSCKSCFDVLVDFNIWP